MSKTDNSESRDNFKGHCITYLIHIRSVSADHHNHKERMEWASLLLFGALCVAMTRLFPGRETTVDFCPKVGLLVLSSVALIVLFGTTYIFSRIQNEQKTFAGTMVAAAGSTLRKILSGDVVPSHEDFVQATVSAEDGSFSGLRDAPTILYKEYCSARAADNRTKRKPYQILHYTVRMYLVGVLIVALIGNYFSYFPAGSDIHNLAQESVCNCFKTE